MFYTISTRVERLAMKKSQKLKLILTFCQKTNKKFFIIMKPGVNVIKRFSLVANDEAR
jgi:hypothetical protein